MARVPERSVKMVRLPLLLQRGPTFAAKAHCPDGVVTGSQTSISLTNRDVLGIGMLSLATGSGTPVLVEKKHQ